MGPTWSLLAEKKQSHKKHHNCKNSSKTKSRSKWLHLLKFFMKTQLTNQRVLLDIIDLYINHFLLSELPPRQWRGLIHSLLSMLQIFFDVIQKLEFLIRYSLYNGKNATKMDKIKLYTLNWLHSYQNIWMNTTSVLFKLDLSVSSFKTWVTLQYNSYFHINFQIPLIRTFYQM